MTAGTGGQRYALHLQGDCWAISGITVTNARKGGMIDGVTGVMIDGVAVHTIGHEAVHVRTHTTDNTIQNCVINDTGPDNETFAEGGYLGTAVSNWARYTKGEPDHSEGNASVSTPTYTMTASTPTATPRPATATPRPATATLRPATATPVPPQPTAMPR